MTHRRTTTTVEKLAVQGAAVTLGLLLALGLTGCGDAAEAESARAGSAVQASPSPTPVVTVEQEDVTEVVPFDAVSVDDATRDIGQDAVTVTGQNGSMVLTYDVTYTDGVETSRTLVGQSAVVAPVQQVTSVGSRAPYVAPAPVAAPAPAPAASGCDANYSGACVPVASDVDCAGGSGNGPAYVQGPVTIVGSDVYDLDRDGDGIACDR